MENDQFTQNLLANIREKEVARAVRKTRWYTPNVMRFVRALTGKGKLEPESD
jgi:hypothetical protein